MAKSATKITLDPEEEQTLRGWLRSHKTERRMVERTRIVLLAAGGASTCDRPTIGDAAGTRIKVASQFC